MLGLSFYNFQEERIKRGMKVKDNGTYISGFNKGGRDYEPDE